MNRLLKIVFLLACLYLGWRHFGPQQPAAELTAEGIAQLAAQVKPEDIVMYTTTDCPYCAQAKSWLNQHGFAFTECDAQQRPECAQQLQALGSKGVPYLLVRGKHMKDGFDSDEFLSLLSQ